MYHKQYAGALHCVWPFLLDLEREREREREREMFIVGMEEKIKHAKFCLGLVTSRSPLHDFDGSTPGQSILVYLSQRKVIR